MLVLRTKAASVVMTYPMSSGRQAEHDGDSVSIAARQGAHGDGLVLTMSATSGQTDALDDSTDHVRRGCSNDVPMTIARAVGEPTPTPRRSRAATTAVPNASRASANRLPAGVT